MSGDELGWVIERYRDSILQYWSPSSEDWCEFKEDPNKAIRFARSRDAEIILTRIGGIGRVTQHCWPEGSVTG